MELFLRYLKGIHKYIKLLDLAGCFWSCRGSQGLRGGGGWGWTLSLERGNLNTRQTPLSSSELSGDVTLLSAPPQLLSEALGQLPSLKVCEWVRWEPGSEIPCQPILLFSRVSSGNLDRMGRWKVTFLKVQAEQGRGCTVLFCDLSAFFLFQLHSNSSFYPLPGIVLLPHLTNIVYCESQLWQAAFLIPHMQVNMPPVYLLGLFCRVHGSM